MRKSCRRNPVEEYILELLRMYPGLTMTLIQKHLLKGNFSPKTGCKAVYDLLKSKHLRREDGIGIRGGYGYFLTSKCTRSYPSQWQHLLADD